MEIEKQAYQYIIKTLNAQETKDQVFKKELKKRFNIDEKGRIRLMSALMQSGTVEARQQGDSIIYSISTKLKKRSSIEEKPKKRNLK
jgi:predicted transcriptional regulator